MAIGELDSAFDAFRRAREIDARTSTALWNLAELYKHFQFDQKMAKVRPKMHGQKPPIVMHPWAKDV